MSWAEARDPHTYRPIIIALLMRFLQQLTGITPILVYLQPIFESTAVLLVRAWPHDAPWLHPKSSLTEHLLCAMCQDFTRHWETARVSTVCHAPVLRVTL